MIIGSKENSALPNNNASWVTSVLQSPTEINNSSKILWELFLHVPKIKTYAKNEENNGYHIVSEGSAVIISQKRIITNAHVILENNVPTGK